MVPSRAYYVNPSTRWNVLRYILVQQSACAARDGTRFPVLTWRILPGFSLSPLLEYQEAVLGLGMRFLCIRCAFCDSHVGYDHRREKTQTQTTRRTQALSRLSFKSLWSKQASSSPTKRICCKAIRQHPRHPLNTHCLKAG
eukprot:2525381-Rhodomonas_salina.1